MSDDEQINKKIKEAAENFQPAYDDAAWNSMEQILDKELPLKKDNKKRYFLLALIALLISSFGYFMYLKHSKYIENPILTTSKLKAKTFDDKTLKNKQPANNLPARISAKNEPNYKSKLVVVTTNVISSSRQKPVARDAMLKDLSHNLAPNSTNKTFENKKKTNTIYKKYLPGINQNVDDLSGILIAKETDTKEINDKKKNVGNPDSSNFIAVSPKAITSGKSDTVKSKQVIKDDALTADKNKNVNETSGFNNNFAIIVSAGPDVSSVQFANAGKISINYGVGISYKLSRKFKISTGFYFSKKIYSANTSQYHSASSAPNPGYLYNVNAACKVYEIPLLISYNFGKSKSHEWFASAGISSYLMNKESYDYYYKYPSGYTYIKTRTIYNQNKNLFSVLDVSGGYEYFVNRKISLIAQPYVKVPLMGVGAGKVQLNSAGVLFSFTIKPFR